MKIGMTGNRNSISGEGLAVLVKYLNNNIKNIKEVHHGDCVGSDKTFHDIASAMKIKTIIHPPLNNTLRAYCKGTIIKNEKPYIDRNHDIVDETNILIAFPSSKIEILKSGTWATIRYARKQKKPILIIYPDGTSNEE